jgi:hypothetical protein
MSWLRFYFRDAFRLIAGIVFAFVLAFAWPGVLTAQQSGTAIVFLGEPKVSEDFWPVLFQSVREELEAGVGELADGVALEWNPSLLRREDLVRGIQAASVIEVKLLGRCDVCSLRRIVRGVEPVATRLAGCSGSRERSSRLYSSIANASLRCSARQRWV